MKTEMRDKRQGYLYNHLLKSLPSLVLLFTFTTFYTSKALSQQTNQCSSIYSNSAQSVSTDRTTKGKNNYTNGDHRIEINIADKMIIDTISLATTNLARSIRDRKAQLLVRRQKAPRKRRLARTRKRGNDQQ